MTDYRYSFYSKQEMEQKRKEEEKQRKKQEEQERKQQVSNF